MPIPYVPAPTPPIVLTEFTIEVLKKRREHEETELKLDAIAGIDDYLTRIARLCLADVNAELARRIPQGPTYSNKENEGE